MARRAYRAHKNADGPMGAQEPDKNWKQGNEKKPISILKWDYDENITIGTLNCWGLMKSGKREEIEHYMKKRNIKILVLQETKINISCMEQRKNYTFYFSGNPEIKNAAGEVNHYTHAGVGIVINNELLNYIREIEPINDRIMSITLGYTVPITIICNYSRTATEGHTFEQKTEHYDKLEETTKTHLNKGPTYTCGDFNAKLQ